MALPSADSIADIQAFFLQHVPQMAAGQISLNHYDGKRLSLSAPLAPNINDKGTAFGGSVSNICLVAGWSMTCLVSRGCGFDGDLVIAKSEIEFLRPLRSDIYAEVDMPDAAAVAAFAKRFSAKGRASMQLEVRVSDEQGELCARFQGKYALVVANPND